MTLVVSYGLLAIIISIPAGFLNIANAQPQIDQTAVLIQAAICLAAPLIAATIPLVAGARITVREAISTCGLTGATGFVDRAVVRVRSVPYSVLLVIG